MHQILRTSYILLLPFVYLSSRMYLLLIQTSIYREHMHSADNAVRNMNYFTTEVKRYINVAMSNPTVATEQLLELLLTLKVCSRN